MGLAGLTNVKSRDDEQGQAYMDGKLEDYEFGPDDLKKSLACLEGLPKP